MLKIENNVVAEQKELNIYIYHHEIGLLIADKAQCNVALKKAVSKSFKKELRNRLKSIDEKIAEKKDIINSL